MGQYYYDHDAAWSATSINSSAIANAADATTAAISNDGKLGTEVSVEIAYGATVNEGAKVYILRDVDATNYEAEVDGPWGFEMPSAVSATRRRAITVPPSISSFKVLVTNDSGASVTATVRTRQVVGGTA